MNITKQELKKLIKEEMESVSSAPSQNDLNKAYDQWHEASSNMMRVLRWSEDEVLTRRFAQLYNDQDEMFMDYFEKSLDGNL